MCLTGSVVIVLHAPPDKEIESINTMLDYAIAPGTFALLLHSASADWDTIGFLFYCVAVAIFDAIMIYRISPKYGRMNPLIYLSICSTSGSISVMAIKAFGIALKLTFRGDNQFVHASTYVFIIVVVVCILTQLNYFNKALATFSTNM